MRKIKLFLACMLMLSFGFGQLWATEELKATIDFASNDFGIPTTKTVDANTYTHDGISITLTGTTGNGYAYYTSGYLLMGKEGASLEFSTFSWNTTKIVITGRSGASSATKQNVFVGSDAICTETIGATGTNTYEINSVYQNAGTAYTLKVTSAHNTQITKIEIYGEDAGGTPTCATPTFSPAAGAVLSGTEVTISSTTDGATIYYTTDGTDPSTSSATTQPVVISENTTIKAIAVKDGCNNSSVASAEYTIATPLTTMDAIFAAATTAGNTATDVYITFNDWIVSGAKGNTAYVTDGTKGFIVYYSGHGFNEGDILSGTGSFKLKLYNGAAEITAKNSGTITATPGGSATLNVLDAAGIDALSGVNTGSLIKISGEATSTSIVAGVTLYKTIYEASSLPSLETGKTYNCTGVYVQFSSTKEMMPRVAADIEEVVAVGAPEAPTFSVAAGTYTSVQTVELECATAGATIYYTTDGSTPDNTSTEYTAAITVDATMTIKAIAIKESVSSTVATAAYTINLPADPEVTCTWDLSTDSYVKDPEPTADLIQWTSTYVTMQAEKNGGSTGVNNYIPTTRTSTRFYTSNKITITPAGKEITTIVFTAATSGYATALKNGTWTNATATADDVTVTVTASGEGPVVCVLGANTGLTAVTVNYKDLDLTKPATPTFSVAAGTYTSVQSVEIECATAGATIYYTTDGTTPTSGSTAYTAAISVDADMTIKAIAIKDEKSSNVAEAAYVINLPATEETQKTWDLTIDETATASDDELTWTATYVDMSVTRGTSTKANNYYPGTAGKTYTETRFYNGATLNVTPNGKQITSIVITANSSGSATALKNGTWTNGTAVAEGSTVTVTVSAPGEVSVLLASNSGATAVTVNYTDIDPTLPVAPTFNPAAGTYTSAQSVEIECATAGATIYYTTDGTTPTSGSTAYTAAIAVDASMTIKAVAIKDEKVGPIATAAYVINLPLTTMQAVFDEATSIGGTAQEVNIQFDNWVVSGISTDGKNVYVTDGTKGFVIYGEEHGFAINDKLNGTVACNLKLYKNFAEVEGLKADATGLTVTHDGVVTPTAANIADLGAVNAGAPIILSNVKFDGTNLTDGTNSIQPYAALYADAVTSLTENKYYNITGIYVHFNTTKEIAPRSAADIEELASTAPTMAWYVDNLKSAEITTSHVITVGDAFAPYFETNSDGELTYSSSDQTIAEINATTGELTLKGVVGSTTITCAVAADAVNNLLADSKSFTLQVKAAATVDNVVIVAQFNDGVEDKWLALKHDKTALEVNYSAGTIYDLSIADQAEITWKRSVSGDDVTFQDPSNDNYLKGSTGSTMSVAAGESGHYIWHWETDGFYTTLTSGTLRTPLYQGNAGEFKYYAVSNAGSSSSGGYSELPVVTAAVFATSTSTADYTRDDSWIAPGQLGTVCISHGVASVNGANIYQVAGKQAGGNVVFESVTTMEPGKPYLFEATANVVEFFYSAEAEAASAGNHKGMYGTFGNITITDDLANTYYFAGHTLWSAVDLTSTGLSVPANRAYIKMDQVPNMSASPAPGKRYITLSVNGNNGTTGIGELNASETPVKMIIDGKLYILRGEKMYNANGQLVK